MTDLRALLHDAVPEPDRTASLVAIAGRSAALRRRRRTVLAAAAGAVFVTASVGVVASLPTTDMDTVLGVVATTLPSAQTTTPSSSTASSATGLATATAPPRCCTPEALQALPLDQRLRATVPPVETAEGLWLASRPALPNDAGYVGDYAELVLVDTARSALAEVFPLPGLAPEQLLVTDDAVYVSRQGDGGLPFSLLARVDRQTRQIVVRVFPGGIDGTYEPPGGTLPPGWTVTEGLDEGQFQRLQVDGTTVTVSGSGRSLTFDAHTLALLPAGIR